MNRVLTLREDYGGVAQIWRMICAREKVSKLKD